MSQPVHIAVIGAAGLIGLRHVSHILSEPSTHLTAILDPTPAGQTLASTHSIPNSPTLDALLDAMKTGEVRVDAAIVATPNHTHVEIGMALVEAGITVLVEKPISTDTESARKLVEASKKNGSGKLLVGHHRRFNPYLRAAKKCMTSNSLGRIIAVQGTWALLKDVEYFKLGAWRTKKGQGGPVLINMIHEVDNLLYLFGDITRVYVEKGENTRDHECEETAAMTLKFKSGAVGTFLLSDAVASPYNWESATGENPAIPAQHQCVYTIMGTEGSISLPELKRWYYTGGSWTTPFLSDMSLREEVDDVPPFTLQLRNLVGVHRGEEEPMCSGDEGYKDLVVIEAIVESMETGKPVDIIA
ncbi:NAD(P)-binding protein [Saitoella complicata NRRL Y-17804]|uniref:NAD(P)-binding protein n=1 Tax=Saitoella complicata (strain BCRC 22490 / CBS 7301 / JCM 7358 / NBRC 10748 / NRRL Y-17804) TaxID=698492 RepID=UPI000866A8CD|nr:NAD(P)-binding protein [Saitoella complicata NRRL Y-17804]ODQ55848.1 NAD(P)-binding protein [Saitoella complicata NRRL Y-17804]